MLRPEKYLDLENSVLTISSQIIKYLKKNKNLSISELINKLISLKGEKARENFLPALNLLYLIGKIDYIAQADLIRLIK